LRSTIKNKRSRRGNNANKSSRLPPKRGQGWPHLKITPCRLLVPTGMVGGVETSCHTPLPSLNYAGSNVQPSVITHSLTCKSAPTKQSHAQYKYMMACAAQANMQPKHL
jgi:hypothetical protein